MSGCGRRIVFTGGTLVTMNDDLDVLQGDLLIEGARIVALGPKAAVHRKADETVDCRGRIVMPGFVQPHVHLCQTLFRGGADGLTLLEWLGQRIWPMEAAHTHESLYVSALLGAVELLRGGTTAVLDMGTVRYTDAIFEAVKKVGLRATIGKAMMDQGHNLPAGLRESTRDSLDESIALAERWHGQENGRLRYAFAPRFVLSCSDLLLEGVAVAARARGLRIHTHASENSEEVMSVRERFGDDNVSVLHELGCTGADTVLAHCVWLTAKEQRLLADTGTHVAHCPSSNLKLASGVARIPDLLEQGINVGLASDGAACSNALDIFTEMRLAGLIHAPRFGPGRPAARDVVWMATRGGARALGLDDEIGSLEVGKKSDVVVIDPRKVHAAPLDDPLDDPYGLLVYALTRHDVEHVFVDGDCRVRKGRVLGVVLARLLARARETAVRIVAPVLGTAGTGASES